MILKQYDDLRLNYPGSLVLIRVGEFYNAFKDDAIVISRELNISPTKYNGEHSISFSQYMLNPYIARLLQDGRRVVVCEQI